ncbi:MAG: oligosaccharide flippase family protein, partial [Promethearchaeia archaeon]
MNNLDHSASTNFGEKQGIDSHLQTIGNKSIKIFIGTIIGAFLSFLTQVFIARYFNSSEFGIFSLGLTILNICIILGTLGLRTGLSRQISYFRELGESKKMNSILFFSVVAAILSGCAIFLLLFFSADILASAVFTNPELTSIIRLFSIGIPFLVLIHLFSSIFRGFKRVIERIIFLDISINLFFLFFLVLKEVINYS